MRGIPHFDENTPVILEVSEAGFTVKKAIKPYTPLPFTEEQLLSGLDSSSVHSDLLSAITEKEWPE